MKKLSYILSILIFAGLFSCSQKQPEFVSLFNDENFDGWYLKLRNGDEDLAKKVYAIEDGMIHVFNHEFPDTFELGGKNNTHGLFYTDSVYSKFHLKFEYKWGSKIANNFDQWQYDAGCYYHVIDDKIWPVGLEYQIRYDHTKDQNHTGDFWASKPLTWYATADSSTFLAPQKGGVTVENKKGEILASPNPTYNALNDEWNVCEIIVMEDQYTIHKLNGKIVNMATNLTLKEGKIGFQSETAEIFYRNIELKKFDEVVPMEQFIAE